MGLYCHSLKSFFSKYFQHFCAIWKIRKQLDHPQRNPDDYDFLPAHLELIEKPLSPLPKWVARLMILFTFIALIWSILGKVDIVAVATGKLAYSGKSKIIQPIETAIVHKILVQEGQPVEQGQNLLELVALGAEQDHLKSKQGLQNAELAQARSKALLNAIETNQPPRLQLTNQEIEESEIKQAQELLNAQFNTYQSQKQQIANQLKQRQAQYQATQAELQKYQGLAKVEKERFNDYSSLYQKKAIAKHRYFEQQAKFIEVSNELKAQQSHLQEIESSIKQAEKEDMLITYRLQQETQEQLRQANEQIEQLSLELNKTEQRYQTTLLKSPVTGTVQQLNIHTVGGVVTAAQPLMVVVPKQDKLEVNAFISNQDIGFVKVGQPVVIKIEAFPYTRYGYINGTVKSISFDAIENEKLGLVFSTIISMETDYLMIDQQQVNLTAGMAVSAEVKTGTRRVISYLLSPLQTTLNESFRER